MNHEQETPPSYGPGIHVLLQVVQAQLADASATLLSHRMRAVVLFAVSAVGLLLPTARWLPVGALLLAGAAFAATAALPRLVDSGVKADVLYREHGADDPEALAAQLLSHSIGSCEAHGRAVRFASRLCAWSICCLLAAATVAVIR